MNHGIAALLDRMRNIGSSGGRDIIERDCLETAAEPLAHNFYYDVAPGPDGALAAVTRPLLSRRRLNR
jgi:hypothetical protein